jgi:hypothetical protein
MSENKKTKKPKCKCGEEMVVVEYVGYYDRFTYWDCPNTSCSLLDSLKPEKTHRGSYG